MSNNIQTLFSQYKKRYPLCTKEKIVDLMLDDGVITFETAKNIKSGTSLFLLDNSFNMNSNFSSDASILDLYGINLSKNNITKTKFNRKIEYTSQPMTQGDCWLLSDINSLNYTEFGRKAIYDAICPDEDGSGGVTIKFKGSPLKQKNIHITSAQIDQARKSGNYSDGDDDMIAFELATEITFKEMVKQGIAQRKYNDEDIEQMGGKYRSYIFAGVETKDFSQYPMSELLGIKTKKVDCFMAINESATAEKDKNNLFKYVSENKNNISGWCSFLGEWGNKNSKNRIHDGHAYAIKTVTYGKNVVLTDPHYSNYDIVVPWKVFIEHIRDISFSFKNSQEKSRFEKNGLPKNYESNLKKNNEEIMAFRNKFLQKK